ncbi:hypothetical protein [Paenarthrobacter sp. PH39-S1]|uniref:transposase n=1 Tax=Paenarthrobacter sp. PH39-S1 TaxID=3046204 RepID=UPI0024B9F704|nr:hypothetical protein [Paenarthrobacter sp. PH39-S1]MDJ0358460.1 hypothetical protein [Paenarthrobacter sp. PH39-S1]
MVKKRQRRGDGSRRDRVVAEREGPTTWEIAAHFGEVFGAGVSKDTVSRITEKVTGTSHYSTDHKSYPSRWPRRVRSCSAMAAQALLPALQGGAKHARAGVIVT